jgi:hypothetical protein
MNKKHCRYIQKVWNKYDFMGINTWKLKYHKETPKLIAKEWKPLKINVHVEILERWIDNPAEALEYLTLPQALTTRIRTHLAQYFLEHGI